MTTTMKSLLRLALVSFFSYGLIHHLPRAETTTLQVSETFQLEKNTTLSGCAWQKRLQSMDGRFSELNLSLFMESEHSPQCVAPSSIDSALAHVKLFTTAVYHAMADSLSFCLDCCQTWWGTPTTNLSWKYKHRSTTASNVASVDTVPFYDGEQLLLLYTKTWIEEERKILAAVPWANKTWVQTLLRDPKRRFGIFVIESLPFASRLASFALYIPAFVLLVLFHWTTTLHLDRSLLFNPWVGPFWYLMWNACIIYIEIKVMLSCRKWNRVCSIHSQLTTSSSPSCLDHCHFMFHVELHHFHLHLPRGVDKSPQLPTLLRCPLQEYFFSVSASTASAH